MLVARQMFMKDCSPTTLPEYIKQSVLKSCDWLPAKDLQWTAHFQVSSHVYGGAPDSFNMMYQGWLFENNFKNGDRAASQKHPLIGMFEPNNIKIDTSSPAAIGNNALRESDQHVHSVDIDPEGTWRFGSDMSRFGVGAGEFSKAWAACVDVEAPYRAHISYLIIVPPEREAEVDSLRSDDLSFFLPSLKKCLGLDDPLLDEFMGI